ncbi:MAG: hypothetical protein R2747_21470 [Pyrinomonadaceae bacterium]
MEDNLKPDQENGGSQEEQERKRPEMLVNDYGSTKDQAVVIEEDDRTVLLTEDETIIVDKTEGVSWAVPPKNRPRKVYMGMWGPNEIAAVGLGLLTVLSVILLYVFFVMPAKSKLEQNRAKSQELEAKMRSENDKYGSIEDTKTHVATLIDSVNDFESRFLRIPENGRTGLYQRLNGLIGAYNLINTSGPEYAPLDIVDPQRRQQTENERGRDKLMSLFPGVYVTVTVEGSYQNLRGFIQEIETSQQFILISSVELVPADGGSKKEEVVQTGPTPTPTPSNIDTGKTHGETVSLKLEMAAYFSRIGAAPPLGNEVSAR